jgi:lipopolysaccharide export LptBFGC system permease protein LptF
MMNGRFATGSFFRSSIIIPRSSFLFFLPPVPFPNMSRTLFRYVFKELVKIFLMTAGALAGIMSFGALLRPLTQNGLDGYQVVLLLRYFMPAMMTYSLPVAALFATTFVYGRMSADNEITACRACGLSFLSMSTPAMLLGVLVAILSLALLCFTVPSATMKGEQVLYSNLAKLIAHQIEQTHQTGLGDFTVFAKSAYLPEDNKDHPDDQAVVLTGPLIMTYQTPPGMPPWYRVAKEFYSASSATAHIHQNPADSSAQLTVALDHGVEFPREFTGVKASEAGIETAEFGPVQIPSPIGQKTKFMSIYDLKALQQDPSQGKQVKDVLSEFIREDQAQAIIAQLMQRASGPAGRCELQSGGEVYAIIAPPADGAKMKVMGDELVFTAGATPVLFQQESNGQVRLSARGKTCRVTVAADPANDQAFITLEMKDALMDAGDNPTTAPLSRKFVVPLPPEIAAYKNRTFEQYSTQRIRDAKATEKLLFAFTDLLNHVISELHARAAFVVSCLLLVLIGSSLGMMFRSGNFLTAFAVSVIPAMLSTVLIVTGQHTVESTPTHLLTQSAPVALGISVIWSGNAVIFVAASILLWRLQRR